MPLADTELSRADRVQVVLFHVQSWVMLGVALAGGYAFLQLMGWPLRKPLLLVCALWAPALILRMLVDCVRFLIKAIYVPFFVGLDCPACGERSLSYVTCRSFGYRYYRCSECHQQFKKYSLDHPWEDASCAADSYVYEGKPTSAKSMIQKGRQVTAFTALFTTLFVGVLLSGSLGYWIAGGWGWGVSSLIVTQIILSFRQEILDLWRNLGERYWNEEDLLT